MTNIDLRDFLYREIPLAQAMGVEIHEATELKTEIMAPLVLNRNHLDTAFGGSLSSILILSCYAWLFQRLDEQGFHVHVLIQAGHTDYLLPVKEDIKAICHAPRKEEYDKFLETFRRKGLARIALEAHVEVSQGKACSFKGEFVAQKSK